MSSDDESHSVSNISGAGSSEGSSSEGSSSSSVPSINSGGEEGPEEVVEVPTHPTGVRIGAARASTRPSAGPEFEASTMSDAEVAHLRAIYGIPDAFQLRAPRSEDRVTSAPPGSLAIYEEDLAGGLRFPLHPMIQGVLRRYDIVPAQLGPNSFRILAAFIVMCSFLGITPRTSLFFAFFHLNKLPGSKGWYFFGPRQGRKLFKKLPTSIHSWKTRFFFISSNIPWGFRASWGEPNLAPNRDDRLAKQDELNFS